MRTENWEVVAGFDQEHVAFRYVLPDRELEVTKTYRLAKVPEAKLSDADCRRLSPGVRSADQEPGGRRQGPQAGLSARRSQRFARRGLVVRPQHGEPVVGGDRHARRDLLAVTRAGRNRSAARPSPPARISIPTGTCKKFTALTFVGMDCQFFSAVLMPQGDAAGNMDTMVPLLRGRRGTGRENLTNTSFRVTSNARELAPGARADRPFPALRRPEAAAAPGPIQAWAMSSTTAGSTGWPSRCCRSCTCSTRCSTTTGWPSSS